MSGIVGAILLLIGAYAATALPFGGPYLGYGVTGVVILLGMLAMIRSYSVYKVRQDDRCTTCRGAGTVYSAEWNDWSKKGPVQTIRELCPSCEGIPSPAPTSSRVSYL